MKALRPLRIAISFAVTFSLLLIFTDFYRLIPAWFSSFLLFPQFLPSLLSFTVKASVAARGFMFIILLTFLSGRIYCSFICPLGFSQDIFIRMGKRIRKTGYSRPHHLLFYTLLSISLLSFAISGTAFILWLDPFSTFGRFVTYALSYPLIEINNGLAALLLKKNIFSLHTIDITPSTAGLIFSISIFCIIATMSFFKGRLYCNTICPVGAALSIISRLSLFRIRINRDSCILCGKCEKLCKSGCIDHRKGHVDTARCVACFNCVSCCPNGSTTLSRVSAFPSERAAKSGCKGEAGAGTISRLSFISGMLLIPHILSSKESSGVLYYQEPLKQRKYKRKSFSSPPGSVSIETFNKRCTACSLCISSCPTSVLQPAVMHYGLHGIMQPFMDFSKGFCNYDCTVCGDICPTDAIGKNSIDAKRQIQTGKSVFVIENCIIYTNGTDCGACSEHCPTKAVHMVPYKNRLVIPEVNTKICTGCGACEHACPVRPLKAIYVDGNREHGTAELPLLIKQEEAKEPEFPF